jgi:hypothetical protein
LSFQRAGAKEAEGCKQQLATVTTATVTARVATTKVTATATATRTAREETLSNSSNSHSNSSSNSSNRSREEPKISLLHCKFRMPNLNKGFAERGEEVEE